MKQFLVFILILLPTVVAAQCPPGHSNCVVSGPRPTAGPPQAANAYTPTLPISVVTAAINPSRTTCASPCTVVFSSGPVGATAGTTHQTLDEHAVWSQLAYYWDFDTDETDTYGALYNQTATYLPQYDTSFIAGHVPMATKTFLCATGTCSYNVGVRAQDVNGNYDDAFVTITVDAESTEWSAANTICISNTLNTANDWTIYDKACPAGATKQTALPDADAYNGKLVLLRRGDVFSQNIATYPNQSNFKIGVFGNAADARPEIVGSVWLGQTNISGPLNSPTSASYVNISDTDVANYGWPSNITIDGVKLRHIEYPMSYQHVGMHDVNMDYRADTATTDAIGQIGIVRSATWCYGNPLSCSNVPFPKGGYFSSLDVVGGGEASYPAGLNIGQTECPMVNFMGIVDSKFQRALEHNLRIAGFYRINIQHSFFAGEHGLPGKQKITLRNCLRSGTSPNGQNWLGGAWKTDIAAVPNTYLDDVEGRTRADAEPTSTPSTGGAEFIHANRYAVVSHNQLGDADGIVGAQIGATQFQTNVSVGDEELYRDLIISHNVFENEPTRTSDFSVLMQGYYNTCVDNIYAAAGTGCYGTNSDSVGLSVNPAPTPAPSSPAGG